MGQMEDDEMTVPSGPFAWTDVYRAVERSEERIMKRLETISTDSAEAARLAAVDQSVIRERVNKLEQRNAIEDARTRTVLFAGSIGQKIFIGLLAIGQIALAAYVVL